MDIGSLLHNVSAALDKDSDQVLQERLGIGLAQFRVLLFLLENDGAKQNIIAASLSQTQPSISRQVKILQDKNLAVIRRNSGNRRDRLVFLTRRGALTADKALNALNDYHLPLFAHLGERNQKELIDILQKIKDYR